ncbi:MAG TPA: hypothetical protein VK879_21815 [Candidatus Sulfomarinibacteraceae bacterium]|nr:hypothetical protein [Candidatus Sulfomarinibacteraceae bacterium]
MIETDRSPPPRVWRVLGIGAVLLLVSAVAAISLISAGVFDPRPAGPQQQRLSLDPLALSAGERRDRWQEELDVTAPFSLRLTAALQEGEIDTAYGLTVGDPQRSLTIAVSPTGYAAVWQTDGDGQEEMLMPWQSWPHVARGQQVNEIQVDVQQGQVTVRVNREILWQRALTNVHGGVALHAESFGQAATVDFQELVLFHE